MAQSRSASGAPTTRSLSTDQREFLSSYKNEHLKLGSGAFGTVALWTHINSGGRRAIKTQRLSDSSDVKEWEREEITLCEAERSCDPDARYIVRLYVSCLTDAKHARDSKTVRFGYLVMECCDRDLNWWLEKHPDRPLPDALQLSTHLFCGLTFLHHHSIIHRDLKPSNTLLTKTDDGWDLRIADFGLSRVKAPMMTAAVVTLPYRAPEILLGAVTEQAGLQNSLQQSRGTHPHAHPAFG